MCVGSGEEKTCRISNKDEKLLRDVSPSQGLLQSAICVCVCVCVCVCSSIDADTENQNYLFTDWRGGWVGPRKY